MNMPDGVSTEKDIGDRTMNTDEQIERLIEAIKDIASYLYNINRILAKKEGYKGLIPPKEQEQ